LKITTAGLLLKYLETEGVEYIFGVPGTALVPLYDAVNKQDAIKPILTKHEEGAAFMADGYARVSGKIGVCYATSGPGATNLATGVANAYMDNIPLLVIIAQAPTSICEKGRAEFHPVWKASDNVSIESLNRIFQFSSYLLL
jgi:acetolactate synthase-1/2/3 large subunit